MYIAFEGLKGTGKSTLLENLQLWLWTNGMDFAPLSPTSAMPEHLWWEQTANEPQYQNDDEFLQSLYAARSNYHASQCDLHHSLILGDRSILTSLATRWHLATDKAAYCQQVRALEHLIPWPDHVILLDCSDDLLLQRYAKRQRDYGLQDETPQRLQQIRHAYQDLQTHNGQLIPMMQWHAVDSSQYDLDELTACMGEKIMSLYCA